MSPAKFAIRFLLYVVAIALVVGATAAVAVLRGAR